jgi:hypothetical protein
LINTLFVGKRGVGRPDIEFREQFEIVGVAGFFLWLQSPKQNLVQTSVAKHICSPCWCMLL